MRQASLCFDDGFRRSAERIHALFSARGLAACFAVLAAPQLAQDAAIQASEVADWPFWREMAAAGHAVEPHGYAHEHLGRMPLHAARLAIGQSLRCCEAELPGFQTASAIFHAPYLAAPQAVTDWLSGRVLGVRMATAAGALNDPGSLTRGGKVNCMTFGPDEVDRAFRARIRRFVQGEDGWLVLVLHGLDGEGWGTISSPALEAGLDDLLAAGVALGPPSAVLGKALSAGR